MISYSTGQNKVPKFLHRTCTEQEQEQYRLKIVVKTAGGLVGYYYVEIKSFQI